LGREQTEPTPTPNTAEQNRKSETTHTPAERRTAKTQEVLLFSFFASSYFSKGGDKEGDKVKFVQKATTNPNQQLLLPTTTSSPLLSSFLKKKGREKKRGI